MCNILQLNFKRLKLDMKKYLINKNRPSCICLQEVMTDNSKYNLGRKYKFMQQSLQAKEAKVGRKQINTIDAIFKITKKILGGFRRKKKQLQSSLT